VVNAQDLIFEAFSCFVRAPLPVQDPVCTPDGYLFSREAILENLLQQKKSNKRKFAAWEAQQQDEQRKV
jgi:nitric oxide synthase-interacting protein